MFWEGRLGPLLARTRDVSVDVIEEVKDDRATGLAAEVAFFGVLSIFPGLLMLAAALGSLDALAGSEVADRTRELIVDFAERVLTSEAQTAIDAVEELFADRSGGLLTLGAVTALWSLGRGFDAMIRALDLAYDLTEQRSWIRRRAIALALAVGSIIMAVVVLAMVVIGPLLGAGQALADQFGQGTVYTTLWSWLRLPFAGILLIAWAAAVFHIAPNHVTPWRKDLPGAALTTVLWLLASVGFSVYLRVAAAGNEIFGILGGGLTLLIWLYLLSLSLMIGAELNGVLERRSDRRATSGPSVGEP